MNTKKFIIITFILCAVFTQSGCALLNVPLALAGKTFSLLKQVIGVVDKLPKPPPWVFL